MATDLWDNSYHVLERFTLSGGRLTASSLFRDSTIHSEIHHSTGKWYFEITAEIPPGDYAWGLSTLNQNPLGHLWDTGVGFRNVFHCWQLAGGTQSPTGTVFDFSNRLLGFAVDTDNKLIWFRDTATPATWWGNNGTGDPATATNGFSYAAAFDIANPVFPTFTAISAGAATLNSGGTAFAAAAPAGFSAWQDVVIPGPFVRDIQAPREVFHKPDPATRVAFVSREVLDNFDPNLRLPMVSREVLRSRPTGLYIGLQTDMAELWFMPGTFIDFSILANRRKFHSAAHKTVSLGADGSTPTGTAPLIYLTLGASDDDPNDFVINPAGAPMQLVTVDGKGRGYGRSPTDPST